MQQDLGTHLFPINAALVSEAYPEIAQVYGPDQELQIEVQITNPRFKFGPSSGDDMNFECTLSFGIKLLGSMNFLVYD